MVIHDETVMRTTGARGKVAELDAQQMSRLDARRDTPPCRTAQPIPTIEEVLDACPTLRHFQLEAKSPPAGLLIPTAQCVLQLFESRRLHARATLTSFDTALLAELRQRDARIPLGVITDRARPDALAIARKLGATLLVLHWKLATTKRIAAAHAAGIQVSAWTVNEEAIVEKLRNAGIDSVVTDFPSRMVPLAASR
jgi:glycerophosphoryl diester phosphodiesterase